jgi:beta-barrel assembly-enhancing protease
MNAKLVRDPVVNEYVNRVGQNLVRNSDARVPFTIKVVDDDSIT